MLWIKSHITDQAFYLTAWKVNCTNVDKHSVTALRSQSTLFRTSIFVELGL